MWHLVHGHEMMGPAVIALSWQHPPRTSLLSASLVLWNQLLLPCSTPAGMEHAVLHTFICRVWVVSTVVTLAVSAGRGGGSCIWSSDLGS
jgi:hypothetical protein